MKIISLKTKIQYDIELFKNGENAMPCPECSSNRKHQKAKSFSFHKEKLTGYCFNCESKFVEYKPYQDEKVYTVPENKNKTELSDKALTFFTNRAISQNTLISFKIYSDKEYMPQFNKEVDVICFPYYYENKLINIKYRGANKSFKLCKDAELIFYNQNCIQENESIIITEGEIDALSFFEAGFKNVISVPNGANKNLIYLDKYHKLFDNKEIYIAVDNDLKGSELKDELIRRFGAEMCFLVDFKDCKDSNEYLVKYGRNELKNVLNASKKIPVSGIVNLDDNYKDIYNMFQNGIEKGKLIGIESFDKMISWETGRLATWTGIPGHGKSEVVDWVSMLLNLKHGWKIGYFSPENYPVKWHYRKIAEKLFGNQFNRNNFNENDFKVIFDYINDNYSFIYPEDDFTFENIMKKAEYLVKSKGIKIFIIDPYNKIEHKRNSNETETEYISRFLDAVINFAKKFDVLVHLVAHPRKMNKDSTGKYEKPTLYDINGSANFYNKSDYGLSVYRNFGESGYVEVDVLKIKFKHLGDGGFAEYHYNFRNGRLEDMETYESDYNYTSYIKNTSNNEIFNNKIENNYNFNNDDEVPF